MNVVVRPHVVGGKRFQKQKKRIGRSAKKEKMQKLVALRNRVNHPFYQSEAWMRLRYRVLVKHGKRCQACGIEGMNVRFHVDHIKPRSLFPDLELDESNLQVLCEACNLGKGADDQTDWRP